MLTRPAIFAAIALGSALGQASCDLIPPLCSVVLGQKSDGCAGASSWELSLRLNNLWTRVIPPGNALSKC
ncbi:hypothetical protein PsYK624_042860 [Phanerochaete sordida]|uniref:Hydrophobin n=1 Tax=Phanerochaete sordida TaxID=48140 RepID=A0A9P3G347_9APHY|nr:hypothetical protein PsYK624_042860 [Phanerochaete sordida]